ncbi:MAG: hypothetical protein K0S88_6579, partial [Actinomycetia bacterium]|nr:hypothetical protein [Actinomycetes bacterium]
MGTLRAAAGSDELLAGLLLGVVALAVGLAAAGRRRLAPVAGVLFAAAVVAGVQLTVGLPGEPVPGPWLALVAAVA